MRYLTKTRFKLGIDCPTKLFYTGKKEYPDQSQEDEFLSALADGGFQVGELARQYYKGGINIETLEPNEAEAMTQDLMKQDRVIMFEPAVRYNNLLIRIDILVKDGQNLRLIEVKSKSFNNSEDNSFLTKTGEIISVWEPYLQDVAFQKYVLEKAYPEYKVSSYLMMADKNVPCPVDGLNQKFRIIRIKKDSKDRKRVKVTTSLTEDDLSRKILIEVPVDDYVRMINEGTYDTAGSKMSFSGRIDFLSDHYEKDNKIPPVIGAKKCRACEFRCTGKDEAKGHKSGFKTCWTEVLKWKDSDFDDPSILELWKFLKKDDCIKKGKTKLSDLTQDDIDIKASSVPGLSSSERQWLQIEKVKNKDTSAYFDSVGMKAEMAKWTFPLHHIDFETSMVAIPFIKGRKPYEGIIFQFSHHVVYKDGIAEHAGQYLNATPGVFPNYESVRELKRQLEKDNGTIFRYATHENTYLLKVYEQLIDDQQPPADRDALCEFIKTITNKSDEWTGKRSMVDLCELVKKYYYDPSTHGSNSIKKVLPAIMNSSSYLQEKYSKPVYGKADGIKSLNYADWVWVKVGKDGRVIDPYSLLPPVFNEESIAPVESVDEELKDGGAAMTAYSRMQFSEMNDYERTKLKSALLKYCELDTFAMVMIYEAWREMLV